MKEYIPFCKVLKTHGISGNVSCQCFFEDPETFLATLFFESENDLRQIDAKITGKLNQDRIILQINGINSIEETKPLINKTLLIHTSSIPTLPSGEFYTFQLIDLQCYTHHGTHIGTVSDVVNFGSGINLEITNTEEKLEYYVYDNNIIVDLQNQRVIINHEKS